MGDLKIKIFENDEKSLKTLGELLSNETSRKIIRLLIENEMYANEIATKLEMQPNLLSHHLKKLEEIGAVQVTLKKIIRKGVDHKYYKMGPGIFILPNHKKEEIKEKGILKKIFKNDIKLVYVGLIVLGSYFLSRHMYQNDGGPTLSHTGVVSIFSPEWFSLNYDIWVPIIGVSAFVLLGIILKIKRKSG